MSLGFQRAIFHKLLKHVRYYGHIASLLEKHIGSHHLYALCSLPQDI